MAKLKEDYISIDTRLEYMEAIAVEYVPDVDIDLETGEQYICGTTALPDVYKRQVLLYGEFPSKGKENSLTGEMAELFISKIFGVTVLKLKSVSYTHLDVYKRQYLYSGL